MTGGTESLAPNLREAAQTAKQRYTLIGIAPEVTNNGTVSADPALYMLRAITNNYGLRAAACNSSPTELPSLHLELGTRGTIPVWSRTSLCCAPEHAGKRMAFGPGRECFPRANCEMAATVFAGGSV